MKPSSVDVLNSTFCFIALILVFNPFYFVFYLLVTLYEIALDSGAFSLQTEA